MNFLDILKTVGSAVVTNLVPGGGAIIGAVNALLPNDKQLPDGATGHQVTTAIGSLPPEQQETLLSKELDVTIEDIRQSHDTVRVMLESDAKNPHTTRPYIAKGSFHVVAFAIIVTISIWAYGVFVQNKDIVSAIMEGWKFVLAVIGPLVTLLWAYFGVLKKEHKNKLDAANGSATPSGIAGLVASLLKKG